MTYISPFFLSTPLPRFLKIIIAIIISLREELVLLRHTGGQVEEGEVIQEHLRVAQEGDGRFSLEQATQHPRQYARLPLVLSKQKP